MPSLRSRWPFAVVTTSILAASIAAACGSSSSSEFDPNADAGDTTSSSSSSSSSSGFLPNDANTPNTDPFAVIPADTQTITVPAGTHAPTVIYNATAQGKPADAKWSLDRGDIGTITTGGATATFTPSGTVGGNVVVTSALGSQIIKRTIVVKIVATQNGATPGQSSQVPGDPTVLTAGGGVGGVGGEGLGTAVTDAATITALGTPTSGAAQGYEVLYPYNNTVWPRAILAPNVQWRWATDDADAIKMELASQSGSYTWTGTFGRPAILTTTGGKFIRHPIPQDVWQAATQSAGGTDKLTMKLTIAKSGVAYGPITQSWTVAAARLSGIIYYQSYGTNLAKNLGGAVGGDHQFGGAVLSIHVGDPGPKLVAGKSGGESDCRVCHSVSSGGSVLIAQWGNNRSLTTAYSLAADGGVSATDMANDDNFAAITSDGTKMVDQTGTIRGLPVDTALATGAANGMAAVTNSVGPGAFTPDSKLFAFNPNGGPTTNPSQKLFVAKFDDATNAFSNFTNVVDDTGQPAAVRPGWPAFTPDGKSVIFHHQSQVGGDGNGDRAMFTRRGAKAQIHMVSATGTGFTKLDALNGVAAGGTTYLPKLPAASPVHCTADGQNVYTDTDHGDDINMNYEPTVNPAASGGYAWVVFTSRRMYGNVATIPPYCSDPRGVDLITNITPKKLWVAAIDLNAPAGSDASHPAFYLPGQELLAGNARGFWVLDPCRSDGASCESGDQCCNGYCRADGDGGALICSNKVPTCANNGEKCSVSGDCCDPTAACIGGFCAVAGPPH